jgi:hypothetical protein
MKRTMLTIGTVVIVAVVALVVMVAPVKRLGGNFDVLSMRSMTGRRRRRH